MSLVLLQKAVIGGRARSLLGSVSLIAAVLTGSGVQAAPDKDTLTVAFAAEAQTMDPTKFTAGVDPQFASQMFEQLVRFGPDKKLENWLAESWKIEEAAGKAIISVTLRSGVKFHNGDPLTSADFEFAFSRFRDPKLSRYAHLQANVEKFEVIDDLHFKLHFKQPDGAYVADSLQLWALPKKYMQQVGEDGFQKAPVGTGPWKFVSRELRQELRLQAFDDYWNKTARPTVKNLVIKIIPEDLTRVAAFKSGAVDWVENIPPAMVAEFKTMKGVKTFTAPSGNNVYLDFPTENPASPFNKLKVRQAAAHAIDMDAIIKSVLFGQGQRYTEVGEGTTGYDPALKPFAYDPKLARQLLTEAGYPKGFEVPCYGLNTPREPNIKEMGEATFAYLGQAGIRCQVRGLEYGAWVEMRRRPATGPSPMQGIIVALWSHNLPGDPTTPWAGHLHSFKEGTGWGTYSYTADDKADTMVEQLKNTMDTGKRDSLARDIAKYKHDNVLGGITTYRPIITFAWRDSVSFTPWPSPGNWRAFQQVGYNP
jgi:peptide/nickel transport system substrate-binding protein